MRYRKELERVQYFQNKELLIEAQRIKQRTNYDMEMLVEIGMCKGIENYLQGYCHVVPRGVFLSTLLDHFPDDYLIIADESHDFTCNLGQCMVEIEQEKLR